QFTTNVGIDQIGLDSLKFRKIGFIGEGLVLDQNLFILRQIAQEIVNEQLLFGLLVSWHILSLPALQYCQSSSKRHIGLAAPARKQSSAHDCSFSRSRSARIRKVFAGMSSRRASPLRLLILPLLSP